MSVCSVALLTSCFAISSGYYTKGTECLKCGDYAEAVVYLEEAVKHDPSTARNQNNLALAYMGIGDMDKAWYHSRKAALCVPLEEQSAITFNNLYKAMVKDKGLDEEGASYESIVNSLGEPDRVYKKDVITMATYGLCTFHFRKEWLVGKSFDIYVPH